MNIPFKTAPLSVSPSKSSALPWAGPGWWLPTAALPSPAEVLLWSQPLRYGGRGKVAKTPSISDIPSVRHVCLQKWKTSSVLFLGAEVRGRRKVSTQSSACVLLQAWNRACRSQVISPGNAAAPSAHPSAGSLRLPRCPCRALCPFVKPTPFRGLWRRNTTPSCCRCRWDSLRSQRLAGKSERAALVPAAPPAGPGQLQASLATHSGPLRETRGGSRRPRAAPACPQPGERQGGFPLKYLPA